MFLGNPLHEKIEAAHPTLRTDASAPLRPVLHKFFITDQPNDLIVRGIFQQAARRPILIQSSLCKATVEDFLKLFLVEIIIP